MCKVYVFALLTVPLQSQTLSNILVVLGFLRYETLQLNHSVEGLHAEHSYEPLCLRIFPKSILCLGGIGGSLI